MKELPLNGRSYDLLLPLNPGIVNFTSQKTGGTGISNSTTANNFAVSGNRPQQNLFLLNGVEYTGAAENNMQPGGRAACYWAWMPCANSMCSATPIAPNSANAPAAKSSSSRSPAATSVHGSALRIFAQQRSGRAQLFRSGLRAPFQRNQFGALDGWADPSRIRLSCSPTTRVFARTCTRPPRPSFRTQRLARAAVPSVQPLLNLWPTPPAGAPDFNGIAEVFSSPLQTFARISAPPASTTFFARKIPWRRFTPSTMATTNRYSARSLQLGHPDLREQVLSIEETHVFSPTL